MDSLSTDREERLANLGLSVPSILLPKSGVDMQKWACIACDQYTADLGYWKDVEKIVGDAPSTANLMMPEVYLEEDQEKQEERKQNIKKRMSNYGEKVLAEPLKAPLLVKRTALGRTRHGLMMSVDLEEYNFHVGSDAKVRATEKTIEDRLPPRVAIRREAIYELPHILVLVDDPDKTVVEPLVEEAKKGNMKEVYNFELMKNGGSIVSWQVGEQDLNNVISALETNYSKKKFVGRYGAEAESKPPMLFGVGDGNHSLASAKAFWQKLKSEGAPMDHPARHALVEINNVHDEGLIFEPIHRLVFRVSDRDLLLDKMKEFFAKSGETLVISEERPTDIPADAHLIQFRGCLDDATPNLCDRWLLIKNPSRVLPVASLQAFLDVFMETETIVLDFIHGTEAIDSHCTEEKPNNCGFIVPAMDKNDLFKTVVFDGVLPRKTFSMGEADEKRFYCELRKIILDESEGTLIGA